MDKTANISKFQKEIKEFDKEIEYLRRCEKYLIMIV